MRSLRGRLGVALAATAFISVAITSLVAASLLRRAALDDARKDLQSIATQFSRTPDLATIEQFLKQPGIRPVLRASGADIGFVTAAGKIVGTGDGATVAARLGATTANAPASLTGTITVGSRDFVYVTVPTQTASGARVAAVLSRPVAVGKQRAAELITRVLLAAVAAVLVSFAVSAYLADRMTRSMRELSAAAGRIAQGDLTQQVPVESSDEIGELGRTFNEMSIALAEAQRREREFVASVSHELRTPITAIRGYAEAIEDRALHGETEERRAVGIIKAEAGRLERMVQDVMDLARLGAGRFPLEIRRADISDTLRQAVAAHQREAEDAGVAISADVPATLPLQTDPDRVQQIVSNLVQNALRVTPAGGRVDVRARGGDGVVTIEIADTGPGIAAEDLPHVFERTYLWHASKGKRPVGTGLGLAIVRELVGVLGGRIEVRSREGDGTVFEIALPAGDA